MLLATLKANIAATILGVLAAIFLIIAIIQTIRLDGFLWVAGTNDKLERLTIDNNELRSAAKEAERLNQEQVSRIKSEQDRISKNVEADLTARLERLRSELRSKASPRNPASPQAGADGEAPANPDGTTGLCLAAPELLRAAENEERHDQLISWIEQQLKVQR